MFCLKIKKNTQNITQSQQQQQHQQNIYKYIINKFIIKDIAFDT